MMTKLSNQRRATYYANHREEYSSEATRRYYEKHDEILAANAMNREHVREVHKRWREGVKETVIRHYSDGTMRCKCGFSDLRALSIDHVNGGGNKERRANGRCGLALYRWLIRNGFPTGYQTLCMNCQFIKSIENKEVRGEWNNSRVAQSS